MESVSFVGGKKLYFISDSTADWILCICILIRIFLKMPSSVPAQTYWGHWMPSTAVTKERPNLVPRNTLAGDEWYRKKKKQLDFWRQNEFTELLCLLNGFTEHRNNWDVMKSPSSIYNSPWQHVIKINDSVIPFLVLHNNNNKKSLRYSKTNPTAISWTLYEEIRNFGISPFSSHKTVLFAQKKNRCKILCLLFQAKNTERSYVLHEGCIHRFTKILI